MRNYKEVLRFSLVGDVVDSERVSVYGMRFYSSYVSLLSSGSNIKMMLCMILAYVYILEYLLVPFWTL